MGRAVAVHESGAVIHVYVGGGFPRQNEIEAGRERVALIVVEKTKRVAGAAADQPSGDNAGPLGILVGIRKVELPVAGDLGRFGSRLPAADSRMLERQRKENIGITEHIMIEKVVGAGAKVAHVKRPTLKRN